MEFCVCSQLADAITNPNGRISNCHMSLIRGHFPTNQLWRPLFLWWIRFFKYNAECPIWGFTFQHEKHALNLEGFGLRCSTVLDVGRTGVTRSLFLIGPLLMIGLWSGEDERPNIVKA